MFQKKYVKLGMAVAMIGMMGVADQAQALFNGSYDRFVMRNRKKNQEFYPSSDPTYISIFEEGAKAAGAPHADLIDQVDNLPRDDQVCKDAMAWRRGNNGQNNNALIEAVTSVEQAKGVKTSQADWGIPQTYVGFLCATRGPLVPQTPQVNAPK